MAAFPLPTVASLPPPPCDERVAALRAQIKAIGSHGARVGGTALPLGIAAVDSRLAGGGLATGLHEGCSATPSPSDEAAATLFLATLAALFSRCAGTGQVLWALTRRDLFAPGLALASLGPDRLIYAECRNDEEALAVMEEGIRHGSLAAVIGEVGRASMPATRRLQLAAEEGGTPAFLRRQWKKTGSDPLAAPSAALTRWRIACAPSSPLPFTGIGRARWDVELVRQRGGPPHQWILEAPDAEARLALPARPGDRPDQAGRAPDRVAASALFRAA